MTLRNLHGKEGVDGSSPSEGSAKAPHVGAFVITEVFIAEQAKARYPLFRSVDPIELATDDVALSALVDAALDALVGRGREA